MFWLFSGLSAFAIVLVKLGAYSVWLMVFKWISSILAIILGIAGISAIVRYFFFGKAS